MTEDAVMLWRLATVVSRVFPESAGVRPRFQDGNVCLRVAWTLKTDPLRPDKTSGPIEVWITRDVLAAYSVLSERQQTRVDAQFKQYLTEKLGVFDPEHDKQPLDLPRPEVWLVPPEILRPTPESPQ